MLALAGSGSALAAVVTGAHDDLRTGWFSDEPSITPALLKSGRFEQVFEQKLKGQIYAQPLVADGTLLVVTEENWMYGLDPITGAQRWGRQLGKPVEIKDINNCEDLKPFIGITGTPVIDTATNVAYFVSNQYEKGSSGPIEWKMHAIELGSGEEAPNFPVKIEGVSSNLEGAATFTAKQQLQRPALLLMNGVVYAGFGSHCDFTPYQGWIAAVSTSGTVETKFATATGGGSIWQSGGGLVSDGAGQILFSTGNDSSAPGEGDPPPGTKGKEPPEGRLGESVVRVAVQPQGALKATDFFSPSNNAELDKGDIDLGSSAPMALPSEFFGTLSAPNLLVQDGKDGWIYLLNRDELGGMGLGPGGTDKVVQKLAGGGGVWDGMAAWPGEGGYVYIPSVAPAGEAGGSKDHLRFFKYGVNEKTGLPALSLAATSPDFFGFGSGSPIVTSNATASGSALMWITWCPEGPCEGSKLRAYNPVPVEGKPQVLWESPIGQTSKFSRPDANAGHIYVGNRQGVIFGYAGPTLARSTESLDLGTAPVGGRLTGEVTFTNTGTKLKVEGVSTPPPPFEVTGLPPEGRVIQPGEVITVKVSFQPSAPGSFTGSVGLTTEAGRTEIELSGKTAAPESGGTATTASLTTPPEPLVDLTRLEVRPPASKHARRHEAVVIYTLSSAGTVALAVYRRVISHHCLRGARTCVHYVATRIKLRVAGHAAINELLLNLKALPPGEYRLSATPITPSGAPGITRYVLFKTVR